MKVTSQRLKVLTSQMMAVFHEVSTVITTEVLDLTFKTGVIIDFWTEWFR